MQHTIQHSFHTQNIFNAPLKDIQFFPHFSAHASQDYQTYDVQWVLPPWHLMSVLEGGRGVGGVVGWQGVQLVGVGGRVVRLAGRDDNVSEGSSPP